MWSHKDECALSCAQKICKEKQGNQGFISQQQIPNPAFWSDGTTST